jgi:glycosyltransferase involved in cell wall biosynthesis
LKLINVRNPKKRLEWRPGAEIRSTARKDYLDQGCEQMHILIDASCLLKELTGIGVYARHLLENMIPMDPEINYTLFLNALKGPIPDYSFFGYPHVKTVRRHYPGKLLLESWRTLDIPRIDLLARARNVDIFHSPNFLYQPVRCNHIVATVHDIAFLKKMDYGSRYSGQYHRETLQKNLGYASRIIVVSGAVKSDLIEYCRIKEDIIRVIQHGVNPRFKPTDDRKLAKEKLRQKGFPDKFLLSVGTVEPRKNFSTLISAYAALITKYPDLKLVVAGKLAEAKKEVDVLIRTFGLEGRVHFLGYIEDDLLAILYASAEISVFPSWDEGFGLPLIEAAASGSAVLASDIAAHREVLGESGLFFPPTDCTQLIYLLEQILQKPALQKEYREKALKRALLFSWEKAARHHLAVYRELDT